MPGSIASDTGPIITLEKLPGGFELLRRLYDRILIPQQVLDELAIGYRDAGSYLDHFGIADFLKLKKANPSQTRHADLANLDEGERAAIVLAEQHELPLLIEERAGRTIAQQRGLRISGIAGQVLRAQRLELITQSETEEYLHALFRAHRISRTLWNGLLAAAREGFETR